ncbi:hypothetical protein [Rhizobium sp. SYY.PMSO]|uniref:hypothetical protein n=1 Tax=Rhizobium sp. SYY.PMSO TaxID=3382192 RepID=UPI0039900AD9
MLDLDLLASPKAEFDVVGNAIDGGRNAVGESFAIELSGGGVATFVLNDCKIVTREGLRYMNKLAARLNGSFRNITVPIPTDWFGPFPSIGGKQTTTVTTIPHTDGSVFASTSGFTQPTVWGEFRSDAALNAGQVDIRVWGAPRDIDGDVFSVEHDVKGWRAYRDWDGVKTGSGTAASSGITMPYDDYTLAIQPPLRQAVTVGTRIEFVRPRFVAHFPADFTLPVTIDAFVVFEQTIRFREAFG